LQRNKKEQGACAMLNKPGDTAESSEKKEAVVIKKYANRRLYNTETSTYVTLEDLGTMVRGDRDFVVYDAKTGDDLTHSVLTQIIVEQESRAGSQMLPIPFLRQLIRFYDDSIARMVPSYLQMSLETLVKEQERFRSQFANAWGPVTFEAYQEQARKNLQMFEQAMAMWSPFAGQRPGGPKMPEGQMFNPMGAAVPQPTPEAGDGGREIAELKAELARMQEKIEKLSTDRT
jgi:polyhydroxyalkanoate synthesis repressor PhaR